MSQIRLLSISLLLATIGLNAAAADAIPVLAERNIKDGITKSPDAKPVDAVRPDYAKIIDPAKIKELVVAKNTAELQTRVAQAEAFANKTPFETYLLDRIKLQLGSVSGNEAMTTSALEAISASGRLSPQEHAEVLFALAGTYYNAKNYPRALDYLKRYQAVSSTPEKARPLVIRAQYLSGDYAGAKSALQAVVAEAEKTGNAPTLEDLRLLQSSAAKTQDTQLYVKTLEKLTKYYPTDDNWTELNQRLLSRKGLDERIVTDLLRLKLVTTKQLPADEYLELAQLTLIAGFPNEAKQALEAGYAAKVLGTGVNANKHKQLLEKVTRQAADDLKTMSAGEAGAAKMKEGNGLVNLGYAYVTHGNYEKGIPLMEQGLAKGISKHPDDYRLRLGMAYAKAGRKDDANKMFESIKGEDGTADIARYWIMWYNPSAAQASASATAPAAAPTAK
jgi:hypothetical protein